MTWHFLTLHLQVFLPRSAPQRGRRIMLSYFKCLNKSPGWRNPILLAQRQSQPSRTSAQSPGTRRRRASQITRKVSTIMESPRRCVSSGCSGPLPAPAGSFGSQLKLKTQNATRVVFCRFCGGPGGAGGRGEGECSKDCAG